MTNTLVLGILRSYKLSIIPPDINCVIYMQLVNKGISVKIVDTTTRINHIVFMKIDYFQNKAGWCFRSGMLCMRVHNIPRCHIIVYYLFVDMH